MARQRPQRGLLVALVCLLCLSLAAITVAVVAPGYAAQLTGAPRRDWHAGKAATPAPPVLSALGATAPQPTADAVAARLRPLLSDATLGGRVFVSIVDVASGARIFEQGADTPAIPASTLKVLTAEAVLKARGPGHRLATRAVAGAAPGEVVLVGAGDPTLGGGDKRTYPEGGRLDDLAAQVKKSLGGTAPTKVVLDTSLFGQPTLEPGWDADISAGNSPPVTALMINGGRIGAGTAHGVADRTQTPDIDAGKAFAAALGLPPAAVTRGLAPPNAAQLGVVQSPPMARLVEMMLVESDNILAECLARQVALARNQPGTFAAAAGATRAVLADLGLPADKAVIADGSGLSRTNRVTAGLLTDALVLAARLDHPELRTVLAGLPVGGFSGTLRARYRKQFSAPAAGLVRAKTGSLGGVTSMAGIVIDADGRTLAFTVIADNARDTLANGDIAAPAQEAVDKAVAAIAGCGCS